MKGRTTCPKCKYEFVLDVPENTQKYDVVCPKCENKFLINIDLCNNNSAEDCSWEECGEPRKTVLSSIKPRTNRPMMVAILLIAVFVLGITTSAFPEIFIESTLDVSSSVGFSGDAELYIENQTNASLSGVQVELNGVYASERGEGTYVLTNASPGIQTVKISLDNYNVVNREILILPLTNSYHKITMQEGNEVETVPFDGLGCSIIFAIFSVFALISAISTYKRKNFDVAVAGSIIGIFSFGFFMIGSILGIIAFVMIIKCRDEFDDGKKGRTF